MNAPRAGRTGRPFLAPIWLAALVAIALGTALSVAARLIVVKLAEPTTFILLRHAEKALEPTEDPVLTAAGEARAQRLANMLGDRGAAGIAAVYASDTRRAQLTAGPLAERLGLEVVVEKPQDAAGFMRELLRRHRGRTVVVVGHSNTVPAMVSALTDGQVRPEVADDEYGVVFIVTINRAGPASVVRLRY